MGMKLDREKWILIGVTVSVVLIAIVGIGIHYKYYKVEYQDISWKELTK